MTPTTKLYVWKEWAPGWTDGLAFAIATSEDEARRLIVDVYGDPLEWGDVAVFDVEESVAFACHGGE